MKSSIPIIYEDNHLLIVEKPVNVPVQGDESGDPDLLTLLKADLKERYNKPGNVYLGLVHRLDRPVGGVMVYAKTSKAASRLSDSLRKNEVKRTYLTVLHGEVKQPKATLTHYLWKDRKINQVYSVDKSHAEAKKAILHYEVLDTKQDLTLVKAELETGRSHQIRVQFQSIGYPIYGDQKYGDHRKVPQTQIALWAHELSLPHPTKKEIMTFKSLPSLNNAPWQAFNLDVSG